MGEITSIIMHSTYRHYQTYPYNRTFMKDKNVAGVLALFLGWAGVHRFYLGQVGLGILYVLLMGTGISFLLGLIDAVAFFVMDPDNFDRKYNRKKGRHRRRSFDDRDFDRDERRYQDRRDQRDQRERRRDDWRARRAKREAERREGPPIHRRQTHVKANPHKKEGINKYKEYDYKGAIDSFQKALEVNEKDIAVHFNIACAYSLTEQSQKAFYHLDRAVNLGFEDFAKIQQHDAFAFLRIQPEFEAFVQNDYRLQEKAPQIEAPKEDDLLQTQPDLLDQIKKLGELRDKGLLTEAEFVEQKRKLLE
jgi:TM2 domain-containing membrane protein YozV